MIRLTQHIVKLFTDRDASEVHYETHEFIGVSLYFSDGLDKLDVIHSLFQMSQDVFILNLRDIAHKDNLCFNLKGCLEIETNLLGMILGPFRLAFKQMDISNQLTDFPRILLQQGTVFFKLYLSER